MKIDFAKRRKVMERSRQLGHCICDPRRPCPCDVFREEGFCPCAGERPAPMDPDGIRLTSLVRNPGCASKIAPSDLEAVLTRLPAVLDPSVISGLAAADDAAIYRLTDDLCLVQTVDVFTPCVDDAHLFGQICAANCLSDVYAMGGEPRTALSVLAFPSEKLPGEVMHQMLSGAMEKLAEAGVALVGGHSIKDDEIKLGFAITGVIDAAVAAGLDAPQAGDVLVLTKPLGTGVLAFARQIGREHAPGMSQAAISMAMLNKGAAEAMREAGASACTDITGFGLFGHLVRMLRQRGLAARLSGPALPAFDGVLELLRSGVVSGAIERNREFVGDDLVIEPGVDEAMGHLGLDAQTSGGLLIAIAPEKLDRLQSALGRRGVKGVVIGRIAGKAVESVARIVVGTDGARDPRSESGSAALTSPAPVVATRDVRAPGSTLEDMSSNTSSELHRAGCCADVFGGEPANSSAAESQHSYGAFMRSVQAGGVLNEKVKELILFGLILQSRCEPCFKAHYERARELGITRAELDEVAWCATGMGGAPVKMFYQQMLKVAQGS